MRYLVKVYTMHEREVATAQRAVEDGLIAEAETLPGYVQGTVDEGGIALLLKEGLVVDAIASMDTGALSEDWRPPASPQKGFSPAGVLIGGPRPSPETTDGYVLLEIAGGLTPKVQEGLDAAGITLLERDGPNRYSARLADPTVNLEAVPFVVQATPYGAAETLQAAGRRPASLTGGEEALDRSADGIGAPGIYEAILQPDVVAEAAKAAIEAIGGHVIATSDRVVRLTLGENEEEAVAGLTELASLTRVSQARPLNDAAAVLVRRAPNPAPQPASPLPWHGEGELIGVADTGIDQTHRDFAGRIKKVVALGRRNNASDPDGHGTHVAGTILGDGAASGGVLAGIAPKARLYFQSLMDANGQLGGLPDPLRNLFAQAYAEGVRVHNNSWGAYVQSRYSESSLEVDAFVHDHEDFLAVIAAGNEGSCSPGWQSSPGYVDYPSLGAPATAKNGLTVGASRSSRTSGGYAQLTWGQGWPQHYTDPPIASDRISGDPTGLAAFSSRGPCDDHRIKPDLVAPGTDIASTRASTAPLAKFWGAYPKNPSYAFMGGTSMACPVAAGCAALVREYYVKDRKHAPSAALLKATLINGAEPLSGSDAQAPLVGYPNYHQGFGLIDMRRTLPVEPSPFTLSFADSFGTPKLALQATGERRRFRITLGAAGELRICLAWTDPPARALQNILFMILDNSRNEKWISNADVATPMRLPLTNPALVGSGRLLTSDRNNNVHVIRLPAAPAGDYTLAIFADNLLRPAQGFAVVATGPISNFTLLP